MKELTEAEIEIIIMQLETYDYWATDLVII